MIPLENVILALYIFGMVFVLSLAYLIKAKTGKFPIDFVVGAPPFLGIVLLLMYYSVKSGG